MKKILFLLIFIPSIHLLVAQTRDSVYITPAIYASYVGGDSALTSFIENRLKKR